MRKAATILVVLALAVIFGSSTVSASTSTVNLNTVTSGSISFAPDGGGPEMTITGLLSGSASGTGALAGATSFSLSGGPLVFTLSGGPNDYATMGTLSFQLNGGTLLTGTLSGITIEQVGKFVFLAGTLTVTSGSSGPGAGQVGIIIDLPSGTPLSHLTSVESGLFSVGEGVDSSVTPEPGTMLLFGSGLLVFAGLIRRKGAIS
jgi:hypothetical protein